jgi:hypothetical protein
MGLEFLAVLEAIESLHDFILSTVFPRLTKTWMQEQNDKTAAGSSLSASDSVADSNDAVKNVIPTFLHNHGLQSIGLSSTWWWMHLLGFNRDAKTKRFYVDIHEERDNVVTNCTEFCKRYMTEYEPYCKRWGHLPLVEVTSIRDIDIGFGYTYFDIIADKHMIEFNIDYWNRQITQVPFSWAGDNTEDMLLESQPQIYWEKKVTTSIRVLSKAKPLVRTRVCLHSTFLDPRLGLDQGQRPLLPKSKGNGYMFLSAFVSREVGFGRTLLT